VDEAPELERNLPAILSQAVEIGAEQPGLLVLGAEQCLRHERKGGQRRSLFGNGQGHVRSGTLLGKEGATQRAPEKGPEQFGPALVCRRLAGLRALRCRPDIERVEAEPEPRS